MRFIVGVFARAIVAEASCGIGYLGIYPLKVAGSLVVLRRVCVGLICFVSLCFCFVGQS